MKTLAVLVFGAAILLLAFDKVRNEHRMTDMYERQAVALERIAKEAQRTYPRHLQKITFDQLVQEAANETDAAFCREHKWPVELEKLECADK